MTLSADLPVEPVVKHLGRVEYSDALAAMCNFTDRRDSATADEIWCLEHPPVYTLGLNADPAHVLDPGDIPVVKVDRGGQVTYHGPGQLVVYTLLDLRRAKLGIRELVSLLEDAVIGLVSGFGIEAYARRDAPGVYVSGEKIASVGLRVRRGCSYHGLSMNVAMDHAPFAKINPCGYPDLKTTDLETLGAPADIEATGTFIARFIAGHLAGRLAGQLATKPADRTSRAR